MSETIGLDPDPTRIVADVARQGGSGVLICVRGKGRRVVCLQDGQLVHVASNAIEEQLDEYLVRERLIAPHERNALRAAAATAKRGVSLILAARPEVDRAALERVVRARNRELLLAALEAPGSEYRFERGTPNLSTELIVPDPCLPLLYQSALRPVRPLDVIRVRIGRPGVRPTRTAAADDSLAGIELSDLAREILDLADGTRGVTELVARDPEHEAKGLRILYGLLVVGALDADGRPASGPASRTDDVSRDEISARVGRAIGADHYGVLGVKVDCPTEDVRSAYYFLARRYHPDRFRTGPVEDLLPDIERYFTQVTEAYNTLIDPERRKAYDADAASRIGGARKDPQQDTQFLAKQNHVRGLKLAERRQFQDAVQSFENAIELDPTKAAYHLDLGRVLALHPRRRDEAEAALRRAIERDPALVDGYVALGELYVRLGRRDEAARMYREALRWDSEREDAADALRDLSPRGRG